MRERESGFGHNRQFAISNCLLEKAERFACQNKCDGQPGDSRLPVG